MNKRIALFRAVCISMILLVLPWPFLITNAQGTGEARFVVVNVKTEELVDWSDSAVYGEGGLPIPQLYQFDYPTIVAKYKGVGKSVATSGCNVTCLSMVIAYLTGDMGQSPQSLFKWAVKNRLYYGIGFNHEQMTEVASEYGLKSEWIEKDQEKVLAALKEGTPVIAHMGRGQFTNSGHYIVLRGVSEEGKILVNDPNSASNSQKSFMLDTIMREAITKEPFMLLYADERVMNMQRADLNPTSGF